VLLVEKGNAMDASIVRTYRLLALVFAAAAGTALAEPAHKPYEPTVGQAGKDVVWVPTPPALVEKMLDMARVTPQDFVVDLGSGDGRMVIAAARRGARALGVEYNPDLVEYSRRAAAAAGVQGRARFVQGDMFEADFSQATVLALFLLTENLNALAPKFLRLKPGTRIVVNGFEIDGWKADEVGHAGGDCETWCTAYLYIVPAQVAGTWRLPQGELVLEQRYQTLAGTLIASGRRYPVANGRVQGERIFFTAAGVHYVGRVDGDTIRGENGTWRAHRIR
jgi:SAM-dependent methyltransferase